ncbi:MAG: MlaC/ttg2D family ABC transporter substrate-binding protein [Methylobacter sp.]
MKARQFTVFGLFAVLLSLMPITPVTAAANLLPPQQPIQTASDQLQIKLQDKSFTKDFAQITQYVKQVIYPYTDFDRIAALVLGKLWKTASPPERERFKEEFQTLLVRTYSRAFVEFKDWTIRYLPLEMEKNATKVIVKTEVLQPGIQPVSVNYRMLLSNGQWKAYDIMIEGVSLVTNYRTTFTNEVKTKGSLSAVIDGLAKRNAEALAAKNS